MFSFSLARQIIYNQPFWKEDPFTLQGVKRQTFQDTIFAKADKTITSYLYKYRQFFIWLRKFKIKMILPVQDEIIAAYLVDKGQNITQKVLLFLQPPLSDGYTHLSIPNPTPWMLPYYNKLW